MQDTPLRAQIIQHCLDMNATGINKGMSGNISVKSGDRMLITPSAVPYDQMQPQMIASMPLDGDGAYDGPLKPSSEWRFHLALHGTHPDVGAVVHAHPAHCTALAIARTEIPPCHYMIALFGGHTVRVADYALFGGQALTDNVLAAMRDRTGCLMANHGALTVGTTLDQAMWRMQELEALAQQYLLSLQVPGGPHLLSPDQMAEMHAALGAYGRQD